MSLGADRRYLDDIAFLARSPNRVRILEAVGSEGLRADDLQRRLDVPRTTLRRNLSQLLDRGWLDRSIEARTFALSPAGRAIVDGMDDLLADARIASDLASFHRHLPVRPPLPSDPDRYRVTCSRIEDPHRPIQRLGRLLRDAGTVRCIVPVVSSLYVDPVAGRVDALPEGTVALAPDGWRTLSKRRREAFGRIAAADRIEFLRLDESPGYGLGLLDDAAVVASYTDDGKFHSILETDDADLLGWAERTWREQTRDAHPCEVPA